MKEYKAIKVKWDYELKIINQTMNEMAKDGWEVVCMSQEHPNAMNFVITFCRNVNN